MRSALIGAVALVLAGLAGWYVAELRRDVRDAERAEKVRDEVQEIEDEIREDDEDGIVDRLSGGQ